MKRENLDRIKSLCSRLDTITEEIEIIKKANMLRFFSDDNFNPEITDKDLVNDCKAIVLKDLVARKEGIEQDLEGL